MRITVAVCALHRGPLIKRLWKTRGRFVEPQRVIPKPLLKSNVEIIDPCAKPKLPPWEPPVKDDIRWWKAPPLEEQDNYHKDPMYLYFQKCRLLEGLKQARILTKCLQFTGFPPDLKEKIGKVTIPNQDLLVQRNIMFSQVWHSNYKKLPKRIDKSKPGFKFTREYGIPTLQASQLLLSNLLRLCNTQTKIFPDILTDYQMVKNSFLRSHITYDNKRIQIVGNSEALLLSKQPLPNFATNDIIEASANDPLPNIYPVSPMIDIPKMHIYRTDETSGFNIGESNDLQYYPHTLFITYNNRWNCSQNCARSLLYLTGYAVNEAKRRFGANVQQLPEPINLQCINMNDCTFNFLFFQLNTLDFQTADGLKNLLWCDAHNLLFYKKFRQPWLGRSSRNHRYLDYNAEVFQKFLTMYLNGMKQNV
ncbi:39S ribosomal protein L37, mitochondrial isoform X1 [Octopus bimaculoides]|uniref:39S ribosomal protein L37, mitochondrial n=1 Tax=Octopus bimaculoides TaxID=37653 RepID=A0A0L8HA42_OCTBM|nr:39S ribosomal protein L37, mitochondrial isoform X1 [Octopus bimaculoides]XP_014774142.1 39S ribosomal protein L37, mitochondrial isoform X1 [Octopus bimaculoides]XP_052831171.1 39S ribosomal protein L37, mitochondrial isoform X1 [Octopus bimaculoides]|eukprot:XP_014774141.1 PREDICTED: 39S ribosomal protein L37, mitochondrial-like isoform X1 [Octopus bimaculoides]